MSITSDLIMNVRQYPVLYDPAHQHFRNKSLKDRIWDEIALTVGEHNGDAVKSKWRNLRDCYSKHLKSKIATESVSKHTARYRTWPWVNEMSFLEPFLEGSTRSNNEADNSDNNNSESQSQSFYHTSPKNTKMESHSTTDKENNKTRNLKRHREPEYHINPADKVDYDGTDLIFLGYSKVVKSFSPYRQAVVKYEIAKVIMEAELENMKEMSQSSLEMIVPALDRDGSSVDSIDHPEVKLETLRDPVNFDN